MNVTIIGGGNIGTLMAAEIAHKGHYVTVYTPKKSAWDRHIEVYDSHENIIITGRIHKITSDMREAADNADVIFITVPAQMFADLSERLLPYVKKDQYIGVIPGSGGAEFAFKNLIDTGCIVFGVQRVHSIARLKRYGKSVYMLGRKKLLKTASIPSCPDRNISRLMENMFDITCVKMPNYLSVTLTPSNPVLHTARLYSMFKDYAMDVVYPRNFLFYEEWDLESAEWLLACDKELQALCNTIPMNLKQVESLQDYYESYDAASMAAKLKSINAFKGLASPMKKVYGGWVPDFESRYFATDFPYGLKIIKDIADLFEVQTPYIDTVWNWYADTVKIANKAFFNLNMRDKSSFVSLYD